MVIAFYPFAFSDVYFCCLLCSPSGIVATVVPMCCTELARLEPRPANETTRRVETPLSGLLGICWLARWLDFLLPYQLASLFAFFLRVLVLCKAARDAASVAHLPKLVFLVLP